MATPAQIAANRRNALKSTGPKTAKGKQRSAQNGRKHGLFSRTFQIEQLADPREVRLQYELLALQHQPESKEEALALALFARDICILRTLHRIDLKAFCSDTRGGSRFASPNVALFGRISKIEERVNRQIQELIKTHPLLFSERKQRTQFVDIPAHVEPEQPSESAANKKNRAQRTQSARAAQGRGG